MTEIRFDDGLVSYNLNGKIDVYFNPTDSNFVEQLYKAFEELDKKQESYRDEVQKMGDKAKIFDFTRARDVEMRNIIDTLFDAPVCDAVFGRMNVYALSGGLPVWCNLILAIMEEIDTTFAREQKATNPRLAKYTAKYHK